MRRTTLLLVVIGALLVISSGLALAALSGDKTGTDGPDTLVGDTGTNRFAGGGSADTLKGRDGDDELFGDFGGKENLIGGPGDDFLNAADQRANDRLDPGEGDETNGDTCVADQNDKVVDSTSLAQPPNNVVAVQASGPNVGDCERLTVVDPAP